MVVGAPLAPTITDVTGGVGDLTVYWSAPAINADLGATYTMSIEDVTAGRSPAAATVTRALTTPTSQTFTGLVAGTKRVRVVASNANTGQTATAVVVAWAGAVQVELSTAPIVASPNGAVGTAQGATITVTKPVTMSTASLAKFLIQVGVHAGARGQRENAPCQRGFAVC